VTSRRNLLAAGSDQRLLLSRPTASRSAAGPGMSHASCSTELSHAPWSSRCHMRFMRSKQSSELHGTWGFACPAEGARPFPSGGLAWNSIYIHASVRLRLCVSRTGHQTYPQPSSALSGVRGPNAQNMPSSRHRRCFWSNPC
jgi:hypothetical protein